MAIADIRPSNIVDLLCKWPWRTKLYHETESTFPLTVNTKASLKIMGFNQCSEKRSNNEKDIFF